MSIDQGHYTSQQQQQPQQQQQQNPGVGMNAGVAPPHHRSRRQYAAEQYTLSATPVDDSGMQSQVQQQPVQNEQIYTPALGEQRQYTGFQPVGAQAAPVDPALSQQFAQMNIQNTPQSQLNQLYNIDLLQSLPPPIADLDLPPPPIILPANSAITNSPNANCPLPYMRSTLNAVPTTSALLKKSKIPFGFVIQPYVNLHDDEAPIPVISDAVIARCRKCRSYINPFITSTDQGRRWVCNMCNLTNDVPPAYDWDSFNQKQLDRWARPELNHAVVEFIAPPEYMVRPPQPLVYMFVIDVSLPAISCGLVATAARTILESLDRIPNNDKRTRIGFICVNESLNYFTIESTGDPNLLVVSDLEEPFLPVPHNLFVSLDQCREGIENLLNSMNSFFANTTSTSNALGPALRAAHKLIGNIGGKIVCLTASRPNLGTGKLENRDDKKLQATAERGLLQSQNAFYKSFAVECSKSQVSVDMFLLASHYQDVASLSYLPRYTSGQTYFYPGWNAGKLEDAIKFSHELSEHLSSEIALEAVLRVRATAGVKLNTFYGNFFNRSSDLCAFPSFPRDQSYSVEASIDETITKPFVSVQAAVLHTTCNGERRIRVLTLSLPTTAILADVYASADQVAITAFLAQRAAEKALTSSLQDARDLVGGRLAEMLQTYKKELMTSNVGASAPIQFCANLRLLPLLCLGIIKHVGLRKSGIIASDLRAAALNLLGTLPVKYLLSYIHPGFYSLHDMPEYAGRPDEQTGKIRLPPKMNLSAECLRRHGLYLIDDGQILFLWVGREAVPQLIADVWGLSSLEEIPTGKTSLPLLDTDISIRINTIIGKLREKRGSIVWSHLYVIREDGDPALKMWGTSFLIEDRIDQGQSYMEFLTSMRERIN
ncbi:hypothetical protein V1512DRAFT_291038 [Lipomyces arxii]|uniref:uncharacterized protein n=1 Tax=Lipomyces arxii TaxID=56418 RepID=UPI0034CF7B17